MAMPRSKKVKLQKYWKIFDNKAAEIVFKNVHDYNEHFWADPKSFLWPSLNVA